MCPRDKFAQRREISKFLFLLSPNHDNMLLTQVQQIRPNGVCDAKNFCLAGNFCTS
ncbi:hypothetical protein MTBLM1_20176 [Rhodospirillaceae bacterium LM-1]|nr:hypothetical protein MTBLM1_20176 [Rhodospirillaceae bacterium LM-1]